ncbi:homer protein homolog 2-like isoform X2 [Amphibalanus amphitrite]|uniref:homer protein homolog 2-like isoform X2 n=1 Tax=Amphibalanus amphitrite TaxID=1232801 RepID=UPI001C90557F|nr:homer protein homolog 2-like isoform X2 [Amphibalanus amphitrite]XP_043231608.1 homer protein homolog 2-like isoform X2 [Amphibalanus amphitrite]
MTIENSAMGEQPIFSCKAHVFHIDPKTKRSWIPASASAVSVSFFYDSTRNLHRIISVEGTKAVINSTITPNMTFTKTSQKFGQWSDVRANTVYGLGFGTEAELNKFIEKFQEIKEATRHAPAGSAPNGTSSTPTTSTNASPVIARAVKMDQVDSYLPPPPAGELDPKQAGALHQRSHSLSGLQQQPSESPKHELKGGASPAAAAVGPSPAASSSEAQLKYENDRLKLALAQSSANAKKWEVELTTLKTNNARLTAALQESTANVEEWKLQLQSYKEENGRLRSRVLELEAGRGGDTADLSRELHQLRLRADKLEAEGKRKDEENRKLAAGQPDPAAAKAQEESMKAMEQENEQLRGQLSRLQDQLEMALSAQESQHKVLDTLNMQLGDKIAELQGIHTELHQAIQT